MLKIIKGMSKTNIFLKDFKYKILLGNTIILHILGKQKKIQI